MGISFKQIFLGVSEKKQKKHVLLSNVPSSLKWKLKVFTHFLYWYYSASKNKTTIEKLYFGLIEHKHKYDFNSLETTVLEGYSAIHAPCLHYGCNIVSVYDENDNVYMPTKV